jgi:glucose-1-phosphate adenylyltransferase
MEYPTRSAVFHSREVISVILGGGAGTRLFPLTKDRSKPAVPLAGKYRIVDIPISNCLNSGLKRIFLLTQFNSSSLHRHIQQSYHFDEFSNGFVEIMAAQQTPSSTAWYQGTADAVRQNLQHFNNSSHKYVLILSGDQLYRMNFRELIEQHIRSGSDVTVATIPVNRIDARSFGIMQIDGEERITRFVEKPQEDPLIDSLRMDGATRAKLDIHGGDDLLLASMGIYVFNRDVLLNALTGKHVDFGKHHLHGPRLRLRLSGLLGGHRNDQGVLRSQPRLGERNSQVQLFRHAVACLHPRPLSAGQQDRPRPD